MRLTSEQLFNTHDETPLERALISDWRELTAKVAELETLLYSENTAEWKSVAFQKIKELEAKVSELRKLVEVKDAVLKELSEFSPHCCEDCPCDYFRSASQAALEAGEKNDG